MPSSFSPLRTGDEQLDRIQDRIKLALDNLANAVDAISAVQASKTGVKLISKSYQVGGESAIDAQNLTANANVILPDAVRNFGKSINVKFTSRGAAETLTLVAQKIQGRQQTVGGSTTQAVTFGSSMTVKSDGSNWQVA